MGSRVDSTFTVKVKGLKDFMEFDQQKLLVRFDMVKLRGASGKTSYTLTFVITDNLDHTSEIKWIVTINNPVVFVFMPAIEEEIVEKVVVEPNTDVLSASIVSISSQGEMLVRFNATVQNSLNLTYLNEQIDIYLLPA